jgi:uncharacterized protein (UPF0332 family)
MSLMLEADSIFLDKAEESFIGAESEHANGRYNNVANRCYYACFQAAIHALMQAGIQPPGRRDEWGHDFVQAQFNGQLIHRRKLYPATLRTTLAETYALREVGDYKRERVPERRSAQAVRRAQAFLEAVRQGGSAS